MAKHDARYLGGIEGLKECDGKLLIGKEGIAFEAWNAAGKAVGVGFVALPGSRSLLKKAGVGGMTKGFSFAWGDVAEAHADGPDTFQKRATFTRFVMTGGLGAIAFKKKVDNHCFVTVATKDGAGAVVEVTDALHHQVQAEIRAAGGAQLG